MRSLELIMLEKMIISLFITILLILKIKVDIYIKISIFIIIYLIQNYLTLHQLPREIFSSHLIFYINIALIILVEKHILILYFLNEFGILYFVWLPF